jgi:hypothetical protein
MGVAAVRDRTRGPAPKPSHQGLVVEVPGPVAKGALPGTHRDDWEQETATANGVPDKSVGRTTAKANGKG